MTQEDEQPRTAAGDLRVTRGIGRVLDRVAALAVAVHGTAALRRRSFRRLTMLVAFGPPLRLSGGAPSRRTVAAAAGEIHRTLAAHVAATRPHPKEVEQS